MDSGERLNGIQEVSGSIPLISTIQIREVQKTVETTTVKPHRYTM